MPNDARGSCVNNDNRLIKERKRVFFFDHDRRGNDKIFRDFCDVSPEPVSKLDHMESFRVA